MKSNILKNKNCLVIGATGNIGRGAAKAFLQAGAHHVVILGRSEQRLEKLSREYLSNHDGLMTGESPALNK